MDEQNHNQHRSHVRQQQWHGWESPVGLGMGIMFILFGVSSIIWAGSLYV